MFFRELKTLLGRLVDRTRLVAADVLCTLLAPLLTIILMFVLYFVSDIKIRLSTIMRFTTMFSIRYVVWPWGPSGAKRVISSSISIAWLYFRLQGESRFLPQRLPSQQSSLSLEQSNREL